MLKTASDGKDEDEDANTEWVKRIQTVAMATHVESGPRVFMLAEWGTSKYCPCGLSELCILNGKIEFKKNVDVPECVYLQRTQDRDELATLNMLLAAIHCCYGMGRPEHLCRQTH